MKRFVSLALVVSGVLFCVPSEAAVSRNLKLGDRGEDVRELQTILNESSDTRIATVGPGSAGNETTYFGILTKLAVIKFQEKYADQILKPAGLVKGTGFVGAQTRLLLLQLESGPVAPTIPAAVAPAAAVAPKIFSISPNIITGSVRELTIVGENFTAGGNTVLVSSEGPNAFTNLLSADGKTIKFSFQFSSADALKKQFAPIITSGKFAAASAAFTKNIQERTSQTGNAQIPVQVAVRNSNGESGRVQLLVDLTAILKEIGPVTQ